MGVPIIYKTATGFHSVKQMIYHDISMNENFNDIMNKSIARDKGAAKTEYGTTF